MENWTNFSSRTSKSAVMRAATGFLSVSGLGVLVGELTHDRVGHLLRLIEGSEGRGEGGRGLEEGGGLIEDRGHGGLKRGRG